MDIGAITGPGLPAPKPVEAVLTTGRDPATTHHQLMAAKTVSDRPEKRAPAIPKPVQLNLQPLHPVPPLNPLQQQPPLQVFLKKNHERKRI